MIFYALILRTRDLLPLTSTTNYHCGNGTSSIDLKSINNIVKNVLKRSEPPKNKCFLRTNDKTYYFLPCLNIICMAMCIPSYPPVLAYSFLEELAGEFTKRYDHFKIDQSLRPYSLIEFDTTIHPIQQSYNKPQQLTSKINLAEITREISIDPPKEVFLLEASYNVNRTHLPQVVNPTIRVGPLPTLEPLSWIARISLISTIFIIIYSLIVVLDTLVLWSFEVPYSLDEGWIHFLSILLRLLQLHVLIKKHLNRSKKGWILYALILILDWFSYLQHHYHERLVVFVITTLTHVCILKRKISNKLPHHI